ncbi:MAG: hypothetical protein HY731_09470 [Candidatus Tectomicrobia bacterium]|nr:hypothetical protein [Candidatus Tectomicrobia bacterium]
MSDRAYFADTFRNLGNLTVDLNDALNLLVRSYRTDISDQELEKAKKKLLSFLAIVLEAEEKGQSLWLQQLEEVLKASAAKKGGLPKLESIRKEIESNLTLSQSEIDLLDSLISQAGQQATIAFRKLRSAV